MSGVSMLGDRAPRASDPSAEKATSGGTIGAVRVSSVQGQFEARAVLAPEASALVVGDQQVTYRELNRRADALALRLRKLGAGSGTLVGVSLARSIDLYVG